MWGDIILFYFMIMYTYLIYAGTIDDDVLVQLVDSVNAMIEGMYIRMWAYMYRVMASYEKSRIPLNHEYQLKCIGNTKPSFAIYRKF